MNILCDGHIHVYPCYNLPLFFDNALANFQGEARRRFPETPAFIPVLFLTEGRDADFFSLFKENRHDLAPRRFETTAEECSLALTQDHAAVCYVIRGRQIVSAENIEVLHLGASQLIPDRQPLHKILDAILERDETAVLAWGFGKWFFKRGRLIAATLGHYQEQNNAIWLGDNSGRPLFSPLPPLFLRARRLGYRLISGSDPLPFTGEENKPGSYGFILSGTFNPEKPLASLTALLKQNPRPTLYGRRDNPLRFLYRQARIHAKKYLP